MSPGEWISAAGLVGTGLLAVQNWKSQADIAKWKEDMKEWVNGSFLRSKEAIAKMDGFEHRLSRVERQVDERGSQH